MIFVITKIFCIPTGTSSALRKKKGKESQYMVSLSELGSDSPIGSDRASGRNKLALEPRFRCFWKILCLGDSR